MSVRDPEELAAAGTGGVATIAPATRMGEVHLTVGDLERSLDYYRTAIGLQVLDQGAGRAVLGTSERTLLVLFEETGVPPAGRHTGLYHFALLVPRRAELASWLAHAARDEVAMAGMSDHYVSEALYLRDPDGHGIEIYWDRPRDHWEGQVGERMTSLPLDVRNLMGELSDPATAEFDGLPAGTVMGHVHLKVADVPETIGFYRDVLGFALMAHLGPAAAFLAAGGYHHHLGANTWESSGAGPPPEGTAALRHATIVMPADNDVDHVVARISAAGIPTEESGHGPLVRDPSGNAIVLAFGA
jgi:catechol 2,3-dioxygenase